jgi:twinkle protein
MSHHDFEIDVFNQYKLDTTKKVSTCPLCSHTRKKSKEKCLMLDWERGLGTCQHCGEVIQLHTYKSKEYVQNYVQPNVQLLPPKDNVYTFFANRGIQKETVDAFTITESVEFMPQKSAEVPVIMFNYYLNGKLINIKYRDQEKNFKLYKGAKKIMYNIDSIQGHDYCVITEGEIDAMAIHQAGIKPVVSVPNGFNATGQINLDYLNDTYYIFENLEKIILCVDQDEAGENGRKELIRRFGSEKVFIVDLKDCKDANEYLVKYGEDRLKQSILEAHPCPIENVLRVSDIEADLDEFYRVGNQKGYTIGLKDFDNIFSTYTKQFIVVTGFPSSGKSDFVDQMVIGYNMKYGWKTAFASTENNPYHLHVDKLIRKYYGNTPNYEETKQMGWRRCLEHVNNSFYFIDFEDGFDLDKVLAKGQELVRRVGIRCLVIDPYNKVRDKSSLNLSITDYTNVYLNKIDTFCKKNDVLVILVAHPTKPEKDKGTLLEPTFYDVKGGGEFYDMSPHGLLVHRDYTNLTVKVKVLKVKFSNLGKNQGESTFMWNPSNGRYTHCNKSGETYEPKWDYANWLAGNSNPFHEVQNLKIDLRDLKDIEF